MGVKRYLLDSNAVNAFINRREPFAERFRDARRQGCRIGTCEPVIAELFHGLEFSSSRSHNLIRLRRGLKLIDCWPLDRAASEAYGKVAAELRKMGRPMQVIDVMLAAIALSLGNCTVITSDGDLSAVPGLVVENGEIEQSR